MLWLEHRGGATAAELARELDVSLRTVYRDVAALQATGVPLWTATGPGGGVRLVEGWRTRLDGLSGDEASSLFLAGAGPAAAELGLGAILASAQTKLLATLPPELRGRAARIRERFMLDAPGWFHRPETLACLPVVAEAVWSERRVALAYRRGHELVERVAEPLGLVLKAGTWYLVAAVQGRVRTYRVSRIERASATRETFERPSGFDLSAWWTEAAAAFNRDILRAHVRLRLSPPAQRLLPHVTDAAAAQAALAVAVPDEPPDGWLRVELAVEAEDVALQQLLGLGAGVEVLEPASLRAALAATGRTVAVLNAPPPRRHAATGAADAGGPRERRRGPLGSRGQVQREAAVAHGSTCDGRGAGSE